MWSSSFVMREISKCICEIKICLPLLAPYNLFSAGNPSVPKFILSNQLEGCECCIEESVKSPRPRNAPCARQCWKLSCTLPQRSGKTTRTHRCARPHWDLTDGTANIGRRAKECISAPLTMDGLIEWDECLLSCGNGVGPWIMPAGWHDCSVSLIVLGGVAS